MTIAALIFFVPGGGDVLDTVVKGVQHVINYGNDGIAFVFGSKTRESLGFTIAFNVLPVIVFFAALMSVLYYLGIMQRVVGFFGGALQRLLQTSRVESVSAVSCHCGGAASKVTLNWQPWPSLLSTSILPR